jgi:hypothetical protein
VKKPNKVNPGGASGSKYAGYLYIVTVVALALTGFGQMPIYKRFYLSDIPGLGWLADFFLTHNVHYLGAIVLSGLLSYVLFDYLFLQRKRLKLSKTGYLRGVLLGGIVASGAFMVIKNFPHVLFPDNFVIALDLFHVGFVMIFLFTNLLCLILRKRWAVPIPARRPTPPGKG